MLLPKKAGPFTLMRRLGTDGVTEGYVAILDEPAGKQVAARRVLPYVLSDARRSAELEARIKDLQAVKHPVLVPVVDYVAVGDDRYILDEWVDAIDLERVITWCRENREALPHNVYLNLATQICNGLEALHSRPGAETGAEHVLHMALQPGSIFITADGRVIVGNYGLARSPTATPHSAGASVSKMEYLSPEQTHQEQQLAPASDIFSLGAILYEMLTLKPMFKADSNLQTIHKVRRAEVTTQLLEVKEILPGLDKVLYRALSLNPRHRYQRAFVLREDLRGLMAGYSFANIADNTRDFLQPLFQARSDHSTDEVMPAMTGDDTQPETTAALLGAEGPMGEESQTTTSIKIVKKSGITSVPPVGGGLPIGVGTTNEPPSQDTAALLRQAHGELGGVETRPENAIVQPSRDLARATPPPSPPPRPHATFDEDEDIPTDVRPAPDETSWVAKLQPGKRDPYDPPTLPPPIERGAKPPIRKLLDAAGQPKTAQVASTEPGPAPPPQKKVELPPGDFHQPQNVGTPPPSPRAAEAPHVQDAVYSDGADDFDDLDWQPSGQTNYLPFVAAGVGVLLVAAGMFVCVGGGGLGALLTATSGSGEVAASAPVPEPITAKATPAAPASDVAAADLEADPAPKRIPDPGPRARPDPRPRPTPSSRPSSSPSPPPRPAPRPDPVPTYVPDPTPAPAPPPEPEPAYVSDYGPAVEDEVPIVGDDVSGELADYADRSFRGELTAADREVLANVTAADPDYTRTFALLYQDARARGDVADRTAYLTAIMAQPENEYRPEFLVEEAELAIRGRDYGKALKKATLAERHWQRLPSEMIFTRKAMMFEITASAHTGLFYASDGQQMDSLDNAIRGWEKYRRHVESKDRDDLMARADLQLNKLYDMQRRLE